MSVHNTLKELIEFQSTKDRPDALKACADYIVDFFAGSGLDVQRFEQGGVPSVVVTKGTRTPRVFLCGHFDVVAARADQFTPREKDGKLFGRGAVDMKSGDAVMMHIMRDLADTAHDIGLMLTGDEEVGGINGVRYLLEEEGFSCDVAVIPDGGRAVHKVIAKEKGLISLKLTAMGTSAHASLPWLGMSAYARLEQALAVLRALFPAPEDHPEDHWVNTFRATQVQAGEASNQLPAQAWAICDVRFTEDTTAEALIKQMRTALPEEVTLETRVTAVPVFVPLEHALVKAFDNVLRAHGREAAYVLDHGASDGRYFAQRGIPVLISQPDGEGAHAPEEWVSLEGVDLYHRVVRAYLDSVAGK